MHLMMYALYSHRDKMASFNMDDKSWFHGMPVRTRLYCTDSNIACNEAARWHRLPARLEYGILSLALSARCRRRVADPSIWPLEAAESADFLW